MFLATAAQIFKPGPYSQSSTANDTGGGSFKLFAGHRNCGMELGNTDV